LGCAQFAARRGQIRALCLSLLLAAGAILFPAGQLAACQQLAEAGFYMAADPANPFFYLLTAWHGMHLIGGFIALARTGARAGGMGDAAGETALGVELCAFYWRFLLLVWLAVFALLPLG
jgi:cytochrome c oxidase subunit 3